MKNRRYKKNYKTKKKKSFLKNKFFWLGLPVFLILGNFVYLFFFSGVFCVKEIRVEGAQKTPVEEIRKIISERANNIFLVNLSEISSFISEKYPSVGTINLKRKLPDILLVQIKERKPVAVFCNGECFYIDSQAVVFEKVSEIPSETLIIRGEKVSQEQLGKILKINSEITVPLKEILIASEKKIIGKTPEGWEIYFNPEEDLDWQLEELSIILKEKIPPEKRGNLEYVDLRFDKVFIYPENY